MADWSIFPNGTSYMVWTDQNCDHCKKRFDDLNPGSGGDNKKCEIETEIALAACLDGKLRPEKRESIGARLNWDGRTYLEHACPEFEAE